MSFALLTTIGVQIYNYYGLCHTEWLPTLHYKEVTLFLRQPWWWWWWRAVVAVTVALRSRGRRRNSSKRTTSRQPRWWWWRGVVTSKQPAIVQIGCNKLSTLCGIICSQQYEHEGHPQHFLTRCHHFVQYSGFYDVKCFQPSRSLSTHSITF